MSDAERLAELRRLFLESPDTAAARLLALALGGVLLICVLWLVRRRSLRPEYTPVWGGVAFGMLLAGLHIEVLRGVARALGAWTISSTVFLLGEIFLLAIALDYAVRLSRAGTQIRALAQELALLRRQVEDLSAGAAPEHALDPPTAGP